MNVFLFHRDLRLYDNTSLITLFKQILGSKNKEGKSIVTPIFIFPPQQISPKQNKYYSSNSVQFMINSLKDLNQQISDHPLSKQNPNKAIHPQMYYFMGKNIEVLNEIHKKVGIRSLGYNIDYTPFAKKRDEEITNWAQNNKINIIAQEDYLLYDILGGQTLSKSTERPYLVFTPFKNFCLFNLKVRKPQKIPEGSQFGVASEQQHNNMLKVNGFTEQKNLTKLYKHNENIRVQGGRSQAIKIMEKIKDFKEYNKDRNYPIRQTTHLSAHLHFTTVSIRQVFFCALQKLGSDNNIINELHWRDFYVNITNFYPNVLEPIESQKRCFKAKFNILPWNTNQKHMEAWKNGNTGFPIVDAAMRQLNITGFMHNRCRMIVASFFSKDLMLDWRLGEQYFAIKEVDYDAMQNSGGWQWAVGCGTDAQPYFRIFNPWTQQKNFDQNCAYIKKWIPQLQPVPIQDIHQWQKTSEKYLSKGIKYFKPIVDHDKVRKETLALYDKYLKNKTQ